MEYDEWGNPNEKECFEYMISYSPYDTLDLSRDGLQPTMLVTGGFHDKRVCYHEPLKFVAKYRYLHDLQRKGVNSYGQPYQILLKMDMGAGHFSNTGRYASLKEDAIIYSFIISNLIN